MQQSGNSKLCAGFRSTLILEGQAVGDKQDNQLSRSALNFAKKNGEKKKHRPNCVTSFTFAVRFLLYYMILFSRSSEIAWILKSMVGRDGKREST
jgi:hypothetical protein